MMDIPLLAFAMMVLVVVATPGPTVLLALSNGSRFGVARASYGILGAALSDALLIGAAGLGLGAVLAASAFWFGMVKWVGVAYLVWLGVQMLKSSGDPGGLAAENAGSAGNEGAGTPAALCRKSFLVAATNPKGYIFFAAFLPQFLEVSAALVPQYIVLGSVFIAIDVAVNLAYASLGGQAARFVARRGAQWLDRCCGTALIALAVALSFLRRGEA